MNLQIATNVTDENLLAGFVITSLLCVPLMALIWMVRVMFSLRKRVDSIEDKLDLVLMHLELAKKQSASKTDKPE